MPENLTTTPAASGLEGYNFAYLDEGTKRMVRRALLKAVAIPGYQVPFASREMPIGRGWGTGGLQIFIKTFGKLFRVVVYQLFNFFSCFFVITVG